MVFLKTLKYIVLNFTAHIDKSLPHVVCLVYANMMWKQEDYKTLNKCPAAQEKLESKLITSVEEIQWCFIRNFAWLKQHLK